MILEGSEEKTNFFPITASCIKNRIEICKDTRIEQLFIISSPATVIFSPT
jgi:hypothetical protein